jgi:hypothetical protein
MKYPKPGSMINAVWEDGTRSRVGPALVLGTSRHAIPFGGDAQAALVKEWGIYDPDEQVVGITTELWHSVTQRELDEESHDFCAVDGHGPGDWCSAGQGSAFVRVAYPVFGTPGDDQEAQP